MVETNKGKKLLLIVDMQTGYKFNVPQKITDRIKKLTSTMPTANLFYVNNGDTPVVKAFNWRYLMRGESEVLPEFKAFTTFEKSTYNGHTKELEQYLQTQGITDIYLCGIYTEACVLATAFNLFDNGYRVHLIKDCCWSPHKTLHKAAMKVMWYAIGGMYFTESNMMLNREGKK